MHKFMLLNTVTASAVSRDQNGLPSLRRRGVYRPKDARRRGSAVVMVIVTLALMAILGAAYIQNARVDRRAMHKSTGQSDIDHVAQAVIAQISAVLRDDLLDDDDNFFNANVPDLPANGPDPLAPTDATANFRAGDEPYDYPYTTPLGELTTNQQWQAMKLDGSIANAAGGYHDDMWLASTIPNFSTTGDPQVNGAPFWDHLTNLTGIFLTNGSSGSDLHAVDAPEEHVIVTTGDSVTSDTNVHLSVGDLVDADGDGIGDSRWTWAPIRQSAGVTYVMAVRIIDNSSLVNANVALSQVDASGNYDASANAPRWWTPSELDLGHFFRTRTGTTGMDELQSILRYRTDDASLDLSSTPIPWPDRYLFWLDGPSNYGQYGNNHKALSIQDELELRYRNGLNNFETATTIEHQINGFDETLRQNLATVATEGFEAHYGEYTPWGADPNSHLGTPLPNPPDDTLIQDFVDKNPRSALTVVSGAAIFAPPLKAAGNSSATRLKTDINGGDGEISDVFGDDDKTRLASKILQVISKGSFQLPPWFASNQEFADQFAVNIVDYVDVDRTLANLYDNRLTQLNGRFGIEALPFITEVHVQGRYKATATAEGTPDTWNLTWNLLKDPTLNQNIGYAIEIRNPFKQKILLWNVNLWVNGQNWGMLKDLAGQALLNPNEVLVLYRDSNNSIDPNDDMTALVGTDPLLTALYRPITNDWPTTVGPTVGLVNAPITIELRAQDQSESALPWPYVVVPSESFVASYTEKVTSTTDLVATPPEDYCQRASVGNGNGLNMMAVRQSDVAVDTTKNPSVSGTTRLTTLDALGEADKTAVGVANLSDLLTDQQIVLSNRAMVNIAGKKYGGIVQVGELAHIAIFGPNASETVADVFRNGTSDVTDVDDLMLQFGPTVPYLGSAAISLVDSATDSLAVPHAVLLLDQLTTLSPAVDLNMNVDPAGDIDNDGDGQANSSDPDEQFVPGTINLNTVSGDLHALTRNGHLLDSVLPIPDNAVRQNVIKGIIKYRDLSAPYNVAHRGDDSTAGAIQIPGYRQRPGIAYLGELMEVVDRADDSNLETVDYLGKDVDAGNLPHDNATLNGIEIDFLPIDPGTDAPLPDGIANDREEEATIARWLMQVCSTRSDIYTAYVVIQGYPSHDFREGPVSSARFFAVFDRSRITSLDDSVRVLGVYRIH